jgi:uncharacterized protein YaaR (DUF327 family)
VTKVDPTRRGVRAEALRTRAKGRSGKLEEPPERIGGIPANVLPLVAQIDESGGELRRDPTGRALERYKGAVRRFMDAALADSMRLSSESSLGLTRRVFSTIARVDIALAELADAVLGRQLDVVRTGALVDQIKGLIVDLYR